MSWVANKAPGARAEFSLSVSDDEGASVSHRFEVVVQAHPDGPIASIELRSETVGPGWFELDGSDSQQGIADTLNYRWSVSSWPQVARQPRMEGLNGETTRALLTYRGTYKFQLVVSGSVLESHPVEAEVTVINVPPVVMVSEIETFTLSEGDEREVRLSGLGSEDPNPEDTVECVWDQASGPDVELLVDGLVATLMVREVGDYRFELVCTDGELSSDPQAVDFTVNTPDPVEPTRRSVPDSGGCLSVVGVDSLFLLLSLWGLRRRRRAFP